MKLPENVPEPPVVCEKFDIGEEARVMRRSHDGYVRLGEVAGLEKFRSVCLVSVRADSGYYYVVPYRVTEERVITEPLRVRKIGEGVVVPPIIPHRRLGELFVDVRKVGSDYMVTLYGKNLHVRTYESLTIMTQRRGSELSAGGMSIDLSSGFLKVEGVRCRPLGFHRPDAIVGITERLEVVEIRENGSRYLGDVVAVGEFLRITLDDLSLDVPRRVIP
ncbi:hypothetical protein [Methanopyrus kandleri]|uniref:Uncharacterized protein n=2 Tax=Methanopyrus kandleri TaxID=2320 RepID=Q8TWZ5_METKA|nr:hypothetical protein [Methanopyrus kandleri]AAM02099.1 Uncharacterized protein MK0886 [Methanopyrus kandleri AV19]HII69886.1 hypothetical protein [Methanopyrus kandleri]